MAMTTASANSAYLATEVDDLIVRPVERASVALQVANVVYTSEQVNTFRVPVVAADPSASWTVEGEEITPSDATLTEVASPFYKLAGLTIVSNELARDSSPEAAQVVGDGLARDIARKLDAAYFGTSPNAATPDGLEDLAGVNEVYNGGSWASLDAFVEAIYEAEAAGATLGAFVVNPTDALILATLKEQTGSNKPLLGTDPSLPTRRQIAGVPLFVTPAVSVGVAWGIPTGRAIVAMRQDVELAIDGSAFFTSDRTAIRATMRAAFAFPHPAAVQRISASSGS